MSQKQEKPVAEKRAVLRMLAQSDVVGRSNYYGHTDETIRLEKEAEKRKKQLLRDSVYRGLLRKSKQLRDKNRREIEATRKKRQDLIHRVELLGVTPQLVKEVKSFLNL